MALSVRQLAFIGPGLVFFAAMLWATDAPFRSRLTEELESSFIVFAEHALILIFVLPILFMRWRDVLQFTLREWAAVLTIAVGGSALAAIAFTQSFHYVNPSVSILLQKVQPLIAITLATLLLGERMHKKFWMWALLAIAGAYFISFPQLVPRLYEGELFNPNMMGALLALSAAFLWAASTVLGRYMLRTTPFQTLTALRFSIAFVFLGVVAFASDAVPPLASISATDYLFIAIVALISGLLALTIYYFGLQYTKASIATIAELGFPLAAVFVNAAFIASVAQSGAFLGLFPAQWAGTFMLLVAIYMLSRVNQSEASR